VIKDPFPRIDSLLKKKWLHRLLKIWWSTLAIILVTSQVLEIYCKNKIKQYEKNVIFVKMHWNENINWA